MADKQVHTGLEDIDNLAPLLETVHDNGDGTFSRTVYSINGGGGGGGTQYSTGAASGSPTGTMALGWDGANVKALPLDGSGFLKVNVAAGAAANAAASASGSAVPTAADYGGVNVGGTLRGRTGSNPSGSNYAAHIDLFAIGGHALSVGQNTMNQSLPVAIASDQGAIPISTIGAGTNIIGKVTTDQTTHGTSDLVAADITKIGGVALALGQAAAGSSIPVVLPAAQVTALTPPTTVAVTQATGSNLHAVLDAGAAKVGIVTTDQTTHGTTDLFAADITRISGTAPTTPGKLDVKGADGDVFVRQASATLLNATVVGVAANLGATVSGQYNSVLPTLTAAQLSALQLDVSGRLITNNRPLASATDFVTAVQPTAANFATTAWLKDGQGNDLASWSPTGGTNMLKAATSDSRPLYVASAAITASGNSGDLSTANIRYLGIDINISAISGTATPSITFFLEEKGQSDGVYYPVIQLNVAAITTMTSLSYNFGPALQTVAAVPGTTPGSMSVVLRPIMRLRWVVSGTTPSFTTSINVFQQA